VVSRRHPSFLVALEICRAGHPTSQSSIETIPSQNRSVFDSRACPEALGGGRPTLPPRPSPLYVDTPRRWPKLRFLSTTQTSPVVLRFLPGSTSFASSPPASLPTDALLRAGRRCNEDGGDAVRWQAGQLQLSPVYGRCTATRKEARGSISPAWWRTCWPRARSRPAARGGRRTGPRRPGSSRST